MGSKIRAVSKEINLQHCRETQPHFISSAAATSVGLRQFAASFTLHTHVGINKTHMLQRLSKKMHSGDCSGKSKRTVRRGEHKRS